MGRGPFSFKTTAAAIKAKTHELINGENFRGIKTGFADLDASMYGFENGALIVLGGRTGIGKTAFALNLLENIAGQGDTPCVYFSLEMPMSVLLERLLRGSARVTFRDVTFGLESQQKIKIQEAAEKMEKAPLIIDDTPSLSIQTLIERAKYYSSERDIGLIIIDRLELISGRDECRSKDRIGDIMCQLKCLARELDCPILVLSRLNPDSDRRNNHHRPQLSDLQEPEAVEDAADIVLLLYRDEYYYEDSEMKGVAEIIIAKSIFGSTGEVQLVYAKEYGKYYTLVR